jgi:hypothetical protein
MNPIWEGGGGKKMEFESWAPTGIAPLGFYGGLETGKKKKELYQKLKVLSRFRCETIDGIWTGYCIY